LAHLSASPRRLGARARAHLEQFRLRRGLGPDDAPAHAAACLRAFSGIVAWAGGGLPGMDGGGPHGGWRPLGPFAIPHGQTHSSGPRSRPAVAGRVTAVAVDPADAGHLLVGTGGGGVWESRDAGSSWRAATDRLPAPAIGAVAFDPRDPAVAYAGTGQGGFSAELGVGLLRSLDGGASWHLLPVGDLLGAGFHRLAVDPGSGRLLAATTAGLFGSADRGDSWTGRLAGHVWDLSLADGGDEVLAGCGAGLCRSGDGGASWAVVPLPTAPSAFDRVAVCHGPAGTAWVFAAGDGVGHLWWREQAGAAFRVVRPPADLRSQQAWYAWSLAAPPDDPGVLFLGAAGLHRGARGPDGRWSWVDLAARPAGDALPGEQHAIAISPADPAVVYVACDGGLFRSPDGGRSWQALNAGLGIAEVGHLAGHPEHEAWLLAGAGGLGTLRYEGGEVWFHVDDGNGGACAVDQNDPAACWHGFDGMGLARSTHGGAWATWQPADPERSGEPHDGPAGRRSGPAPSTGAGEPQGGAPVGRAQADREGSGWGDGLLDPPVAAGAGLVVHAGRAVLVSEDGGAGWSRVTLPEASGRAGAVAIGGPELVWVGTETGEVVRLQRTEAGWRVAGKARPRAGHLSGLAADPARPAVLWATWSDPRGGRVWRSDDAGASWADRTGALPAIPVNAVALDPDDAAVVIVAADLGVWRSDDAGGSWRPWSRGLPAVPVATLVVHRPTRLLRAALLGRGVWEAPLDDPAGRSAHPDPAAQAQPPDPAARAQPPDRAASAAPVRGPLLHLRGSRVDGGRAARFPAGVPDPFGSGLTSWWWQCPDVKLVASPEPGRTAPIQIGPEVFEDDRGVAAAGLPDTGGRVRPGRPARIWVQVHNRGATAATGVRVRVLYAPAHLGWSDPPAGAIEREPPPGSRWRAVAPAAPLEPVEPGRARVAGFDWEVPADAASDLCLLAVATADGDPLEPGTGGPQNRHLGLRSVTVLATGDAGDHGEAAPRALRLELWAAGRGPFTLAAEPAATALIAGLVPGHRLATAARAAGLPVSRVPAPWRPHLIAALQEDPTLTDALDLTAVLPPPARGSHPWVPGIHLDPGQPERLLLLLPAPPRPGGGSLLLLDSDGRMVGGHTLHAPEPPAPA
jgi:hypothetical protein